MKYIFIINSFTVGKKINNLCEKIEIYCNSNKLDYLIEINDVENSTDDILKKYNKTNYIIIAVGGDGMINRVLNAIINTNNVLSLIPTGTGNDFYRSAKLQFYNGINECDLIKINNKYFINTACFGIDADIANDSTINNSKILKKYKYLVNLIKHYFKYKSRNFDILLDGRKIKGKFITVVLCNGMYYGNGFNIGPNALLSDGVIDLYIVKHVNKLRMLKLILSMKNGKHEKYKEISKDKIEKIIIKSSRKVKANIDGEVLESSKFDINVLKKKVKIYYNQDMIDNILK